MSLFRSEMKLQFISFHFDVMMMTKVDKMEGIATNTVMMVQARDRFSRISVVKVAMMIIMMKIDT